MKWLWITLFILFMIFVPEWDKKVFIVLDNGALVSSDRAQCIASNYRVHGKLVVKSDGKPRMCKGYTYLTREQVAKHRSGNLDITGLLY